ncbi:MAG TPA: heme exporter protein CcmB [Nocardioidaceae bacterium]|nr:heme exporter protein CcmB [Nocardioidaceae bacterium]
MFWRQVSALVRRDLAVEAATREALATVPPLILAGLLLAGIGFELPPAELAAVAPGLLWLLVLTAAVPLARGVLAAERDDDAWDLLRSLAQPAALLTGKATSLCLQMLIAWGFGAALAVALLGARWPPVAVLAAVLAMPGVATNVTVFGAVLGEHGRPALLTTLILTAGLPALVAGSQAAVSEGAEAWLVLIAVYDVVAIVTAWAIFPALLEE